SRSPSRQVAPSPSARSSKLSASGITGISGALGTLAGAAIGGSGTSAGGGSGGRMTGGGGGSSERSTCGRGPLMVPVLVSPAAYTTVTVEPCSALPAVVPVHDTCAGRSVEQEACAPRAGTSRQQATDGRIATGARRRIEVGVQ